MINVLGRGLRVLCGPEEAIGAISSFEGGELGERGCKRVKIKTCVSKDSEFF